jgi:hypothetical protein
MVYWNGIISSDLSTLSIIFVSFAIFVSAYMCKYIIHPQRNSVEESKRGESPSFFYLPPLLLKERGIKGVRYINTLEYW